jgi:hypothetical protein
MKGNELPPWAVRLRQERTRRLWSQKATAIRLRDAADTQTRGSLPDVESIQRYVRAYEAGRHIPGDLYAELYCRAFGLTREALFGPSSAQRPGGPPGEGAIPAEQDAASLMAWLAASNTSDDAIGHLDEARAALAESHTRLSPGPVLGSVSRMHGQVQELLHGGRQRSRQARELFRIDAELLAHASLLLDDIHHDASARAHGRAAALCAEEAGSSPALAFSAQAKTARWEGARLGQQAGGEHFRRSADLARRGFEHSARSSVGVLLANQEASAAALLGDASRARRALRDAQEAASCLPAEDSGFSVWSCPRPRQALYALSVAIRLRDADAALRAAEMADSGWASGDPWLYGVWSLIRIGAGTAHVMKNDLDAAADQLDAVITLDPPFRIATITGYLADMDSLLRQRRFARDTQARGLREQIRAFTAAACPAAPAAPAGQEDH